MKYCNNCGNELQHEQRFCDKCGKSVDHLNMNANSNSVNSPTPKNNGGKIAIIIITIVVFLMLVAGLLFGAYKLFWDNGNSKLNIFNNSHQNSNSKSNGSSTDATPSIDILTKSFNSSFLNEDNRHGYEGVNIGTSKDEINNKFGSSEGEVTIAGTTAEKYGNVALHYDNDKVDRYFVVPSNDISIQQYTSYHGEPTMKADEGGLIYDDNPDNAFTIKVYVNEYGNVTGIESVDQIQRNDSSSSDDGDFKYGITSKDKAKNAAIKTLAYDDVDIWVHSVTDEGDEYRVNYGKDNEDRAHRYVLINKATGMATGDTTGDE
ncbi:zinc ribbon domain-containing protein [Staphylococcus xylosus]|uniref:zinc ribbon domain-containing protein n=1 Tax=Staphylococcus xylosus TaxID=1288 RepID=UPI000D1D434B|nr:zinc ribbon domain-containing protein [Staphylococcus xylosus]PTH99287.1 hypothetical protein BU099_05045 [Staphylococcus xylosus]